MKKSLLTLAAVTMIAAAAHADEWSIVGEFNGWNEMEGIALELDADGHYSATLDGFYGQFKFVKNQSWSGCLGSDMISDITGNGTIRVASPGRSNLNVVEAIDGMTVILDPDAMRVSFQGFPNAMDTSIENAPQYKLGAYWCITDPEFGFYNQARRMQNIGGEMYIAQNVNLIKGEYLAFSKAVIEFPTGYEEPADVKPLLKDYILGSADAVDGICKVVAGYNGGLVCPAPVTTTWEIEETGYYNVVVDLDAMTILFDKIDLNEGQWSVIGEFTGWSQDEDMTLNEGKWEVTLENVKGEFKFRYNNNWDISIGNTLGEGVVQNVEDGTYDCALNGFNFNLASEVPKLHIVLDVNALKVSFEISDPSGVEAIDAEADAPVYFNLQGVRVVAPEKGVYIRVVGDKVEKVAL